MDDFESYARDLEGKTIGQVASSINIEKLHEQWRQVQAGERKYIEKQLI